MLYSKVYFVDNVFAGYVVDVIFNVDGKVVAVILAKTLLPVVKVGLGIKVVPYKLLGMVKGRVCIMAPRMLLEFKRYLGIYIDLSIIEYVYKGRKAKLVGLALLLFFAMILLALSLIFRGLGAILYLVSTSIMLVLPYISYLVLRANIPGYITVHSIIGSRVHDVNGFLVGIVSDVAIDAGKGAISYLTITRPLHAKSKVLEELYRRFNKLAVSFRLVESIRDSVIYLSIPYTKLLSLECFHCVV